MNDDRVDIAQTLQRYFHALDWKQYELLDQVFVPGARLRYVVDRPADLTYPEMVEIFRPYMEQFLFTQHLMGHPLIDLYGTDTARATTALRALHVQETPDGERNSWTLFGVYRDHLLRTPEGWRIDERLLQALHSEGELLPSGQVKSHPLPPRTDPAP